MHPTDFWPSLISDLCRERPISIRQLARETGIHRTMLHRFLHGRTMLPTDRLETILAVFGYELDAFPKRRAA
jgi:transcriptional regulator with XRE-family HTH domain